MGNAATAQAAGVMIRPHPERTAAHLEPGFGCLPMGSPARNTPSSSSWWLGGEQGRSQATL